MNMKKKKHSSSGLLGPVRKQSCHHSGALHPAFADHASDRDHVLGLAALEVEEPDKKEILHSDVLPWRSRNQTEYFPDLSFAAGLRVFEWLTVSAGKIVTS